MTYFENWWPQRETVSTYPLVFSRTRIEARFSGMTRPMIRLRSSSVNPKRTEASEASVANPWAPVRPHQAECDIDLAEFFQVFQPGKADLFAHASFNEPSWFDGLPNIASISLRPFGVFIFGLRVSRCDVCRLRVFHEVFRAHASRDRRRLCRVELFLPQLFPQRP